MGVLELLKNKLKGSKTTKTKGQVQDCPNCGEKVNLNMERCSKCGVRIKSMFRRKCPKCATLNHLDIQECLKCGYDFEAELERAKKTYYLCPICGYKMATIYTRCPACNTRLL